MNKLKHIIEILETPEGAINLITIAAFAGLVLGFIVAWSH